LIRDLGLKCKDCQKVNWVFTENLESEECCGRKLKENGKIYGFRFPINVNKLNTFPQKQIEIDIGEELIKFEKELSSGEFFPSAYIVSGNRGIGKTTYINYLENKLSYGKVPVVNYDVSQFYKFLIVLKKYFLYYLYIIPRYGQHLVNFFRKPSTYKEEKILFVTCNFVKADTKQNIIRKLIRALIITLNKNDLLRIKVNSWTNRKLKFTLNELFKRTFHDISRTETKSRTRILNSILEFAWLPVAFLTLYYLLIPEDYKKALQDIGKTAKGGIEEGLAFDSVWKIIIYAILAFVVGKITFTLERKRANDEQIKTLYDDEIAEIRLLESLKNLKDIGLKVIFVIDELDKIEDDKAIETLIGELKPLFLSGEAAFILVTGQQYMQKLEKSKYELDPVLPSLFSNSYHISLLSKERLDRHFKEIIHFPENLPSSSKFLDNQRLYYESFRDSIILRSNRITRKFIMLLRSEVNWINVDKSTNQKKSPRRLQIRWNKNNRNLDITIGLQKFLKKARRGSNSQDELAYVEVTENDYVEYQSDRELQEIINTFYKDVVECDGKQDTRVYKEAEKDFFLEFIHIIVQRIKDSFPEEFTNEDILAFEQDGEPQGKYPSRYTKNLKIISDKFFLILKNKNIVKKLTTNEGEKETTILFEYTPRFISNEKITDVKNRYISEYNVINELIEEINQEVVGFESADKKADFKKALIKFGISAEQINSLESELVRLQNPPIANDNEKIQDDLKKYGRDIRYLERQILEDYLRYISKKIIMRNILLPQSNNQELSEFINRNIPLDVVWDLGPNRGFLAFEIKTIHLINFSSSYLIRMIRKAKQELEHLNEQRYNSKLILIIFCEVEFIEKLNGYTSSLFSRGQVVENEHFKILTINKNRSLDDTTIREHVEKVIKGIDFTKD